MSLVNVNECACIEINTDMQCCQINQQSCRVQNIIGAYDMGGLTAVQHAMTLSALTHTELNMGTSNTEM